MRIRYFLGANSARGFVSHYDSLLGRRQAVLTRIIKGGPGCGKSTLMKKSAAFAAALGLETEEIICSSDIASLDGILIPEIGYAIVDGTAPHVSEPSLCGCSELYLDLSRGYDHEGLHAIASALHEIRDAGKSCYERAAAALSASSPAEQYFADAEEIEKYNSLAEKLAEKLLPKCDAQGESKVLFLSGYTPSGFTRFDQTIRHLCPTVYLIQGGYAAASRFLQTMAHLAHRRGLNTIIGDSPLLPAKYTEQLLLPQAGLAFVYESPNASWPYPADDVIGEEISKETACMQTSWTHKAVCHLQRANEFHSMLEKMCAPYVDFRFADKSAALCCEEIKKLAANR